MQYIKDKSIVNKVIFPGTFDGGLHVAIELESGLGKIRQLISNLLSTFSQFSQKTNASCTQLATLQLALCEYVKFHSYSLPVIEFVSYKFSER